MKQAELFIAIPTWNSARFLEPCLRQIEATCNGLRFQIGIVDNGSSDATVSIANTHGARVKVRESYLPDALNILVSWSRARFTLFIHSDTILLDPEWFPRCTARLTGTTALLSPQDIGCGPFTRPWGKGMPESSFMLFRTKDLLRMRMVRWVRRFRLRMPQRVVNFFSKNVTHHLPGELARIGMTWEAMKVHTSRYLADPIYWPAAEAKCWAEELGHLEYGLGNFYSVGGKITHYHNWYERLLDNESSKRQPDNDGIPLDYVAQRSIQFLSDLANGKVSLPEDTRAPEREPQAIPIRGPAAPETKAASQVL